MKALARFLFATIAPLLVALWLSSCTYDPYAYNDGYYDAAPMVTGLALVATSSSWWGYDPYRYCYYDYRRSCYYDPWVRCYYPRGYRPRPIAGCPHPHNWRPGHGVCPHPRSVSNTHRPNDNNRINTMRQRNVPWAGSVRQNDQSLASHMRSNPSAWQNRVSPKPKSSSRVALRPDSNSGTTQPHQAGRTSSSNSLKQTKSRSGSHFNTPVSTGQRSNRSVQSRAPQQPRQQASRQKSVSRQAAPQPSSRPAARAPASSSKPKSYSGGGSGKGKGKR